MLMRYRTIRYADVPRRAALYKYAGRTATRSGVSIGVSRVGFFGA